MDVFYALSHSDIKSKLDTESADLLLDFVSCYSFEKASFLFTQNCNSENTKRKKPNNLNEENEYIDDEITIEIPTVSSAAVSSNIVSPTMSMLSDSCSLDDSLSYSSPVLIYPLPKHELYVKNEIYHVLNDDLYGRAVLGEYEMHKTLNVKLLKIVVVKYIIQQDNLNYDVTTYQWEHILQQIKELFPTYDSEILYTAYEKATDDSDKICQRGTFYWFYRDVRQYLRQAGIKAPKKTLQVKEKSSKISGLGDGYHKCLTSTEKFKKSDIITEWRKTHTQRLTYLLQRQNNEFVIKPEAYLKSFGFLKTDLATELLDFDFDEIIESLSKYKAFDKSISYDTIFQQKWPETARKLLIYCTKKALKKEAKFQEFKNKYSDVFDKDIYTPTLAFFLLYVCLSMPKKVVHDQQSISVNKDLIEKSFILEIETVDDLDSKTDEFEKELIKLNLEVAPYVVLVGSIKVNSAYLCLAQQKIPFSSLIEAVEACFKCHTALRSWPYISESMWSFIKCHIYGINNTIKSRSLIDKPFQVVQKLSMDLKNIN
ncbi:hypothetical protein TKK_0011716 [Trichogramma kaykai]